MRKFLFLGAALALTGCNPASTTTPVTTASTANQAVFVAAGALSAAEQVAAGYEALPACLPGIGLTCPAMTSNPNTVALIKHYDAQAFNALQPLIATAQAGGSTVDAIQLEAAQAAVTALTNYLVSQGVK